MASVTADHGRRAGPFPALQAVPLVLVAALLSLVLAVSFTTPEALGSSDSSTQIIMPDTDLTVDELIDSVRSAARGLPDTEPDRGLRVVFTDTLPEEHDEAFFGGLQVGSTVWVRIGVGSPTRTLIHEVTHALTRDREHGEMFRTVYLMAISTVFDDEAASRETRRLAWVYDRCYLDDSCPPLSRGS
jgi:hypothetical protein